MSESAKKIIEAALLAAGRPLPLDEIMGLFERDKDALDRAALRKLLAELEQDMADRVIELKQIASGYRFQVREQYSHSLGHLWAERPARYSRALHETLALIAYRQPITRGEIEDIRGVSVSSTIIKTLLEREWIRSLGHREVPGRPALYGTTRAFLDSFGLKSLEDLPPLAEIRDLDTVSDDLFARAAMEETTLHAVVSIDMQGSGAGDLGLDDATEPGADAQSEDGLEPPARGDAARADTELAVATDAAVGTRARAADDDASVSAADDAPERDGFEPGESSEPKL